jgi:toxin ParE2
VYQVYIFDEAHEDNLQVALYLESQESGLGIEFMQEFKDAVDGITRFPESNQCTKENIRRCSVPRFNYNIFYRIRDSRSLEIIAVIHARRKPFNFLDRL